MYTQSRLIALALCIQQVVVDVSGLASLDPDSRLSVQALLNSVFLRLLVQNNVKLRSHLHFIGLTGLTKPV